MNGTLPTHGKVRKDGRKPLPFRVPEERVHELARVLNAGLPSRLWKVHLKISSQGVLWGGRPWCWAGGAGAGYVFGPHVKGVGKKVLHHAIYEAHHGVALPLDSIVRFVDGNRNNLEPSNLVLSDRGPVAAETSSRRGAKRSRERTGLLLEMSLQKGTGHDSGLFKRVSGEKSRVR